METVGFQRTRLCKGILVLIFGAIITMFRFNKHNEISDSKVYVPGRQILGMSGVENCTLSGILRFPHDLFTQEQRDNGAIVIHIMLSFYMCGTIAYVCHVYFVPSLELICKSFNIRSDVAGASFMAAGSSAPEFFTAVIGTFVVEDDIGIDTIVGSAAFNMFFVLGACPFFSEKPIRLTRYPIIRDSVCWTISILMLVFSIFDSMVVWWEATVLSILYVGYILLMYINGYIAKCVSSLEMKKENNNKNNTNDSELEYDETTFVLEIAHKENNGDVFELFSSETLEDKKDEETSVFSAPEHPAKYVCWILGLPVITVFFLTIPDCRRKGCWQNTYLATFCIGTVWLAGLAYTLVWMVTIIGYTIHLSDNVMGLTFLAVATSLPDLFASVMVARDGYGDMAVANIIGSNVFEVLVCLGFLWFVRIATNGSWEPIYIHSNSIVVMSVGLLATVVFIVVSLQIKDWILDRKLGLLSLIIYFVFITLVVLNEQGLLSSLSEDPLPACRIV